MIVAIGVDAVEIARIQRMFAASGERFANRICTADEAAYCLGRHHPAESLAARFAAKEATMKCLGTGWAEGLAFRQMEVQRLPSGDTELVVHGAAQQRAEQLGIRRWHVSLTHTEITATAFVIAEA